MKSNSKSKEHGLKQKHIPERSCIVCRVKKPKKELVRLVCSAGTVEIDFKGKKSGRGAYLCKTRECWQSGLKSNRLDYALRTSLTVENRQALLEYGNSLPEREGYSVE